MSINKISSIEAIALILIITVNRLALGLPQTILFSCGSSSILNILLVGLIVIIFTFLLVKLFKRFANADIVDISEFLGGSFLKNLIGILLILYLIFISATLIRDFTEVIHILYYVDTPVIYLLLFFIVVCIISNLFGEHSVVKTNLILCGIMLVSLVVSFLSVFPNITIERALPVLGYGAYQTFFAGLTNIFAFSGLISLYLVPPMLEEKKDFKKVAMVSVIITGVLILAAIASLLLSFSFSTEIEKISPLYLIISNNEFGKFFQHPESLFVFTWILSFMTYLNIICMFILRLIKKLTNVQNEKPFTIPVAVLVFIIAMLPKNIMQARNLGEFGYKYIAAPVVFIIFPIILILANLKYKKINKDKYDVLEE